MHAHVALHARINFKNPSVPLLGSATFVQCLVLERWLNCIIQCIIIVIFFHADKDLQDGEFIINQARV